MTRISFSRASPIEAQRVLADLSSQSRDEFALLDQDPQDFVQRSFAQGNPAYISTRDEIPLTLYGFQDYRTYVSMWSLATKAFYALGPAGIRETRAFFRDLNFGKPLVVVTTSPHPDVERWMRLLGFDMIASQGFRRDFIYEPNLRLSETSGIENRIGA